MAANKKPRKRYRPRPVNADAAVNAMNAVTVLTAAEVEKAAGATDAALMAFLFNDRRAFNWSVLADAFNVAESLCDVGICSDAPSRALIVDGQAALIRLHQQSDDASRWNVSIETANALTEAVKRHRLQLTLCDYSEYRRAVTNTINRMAGARSGNAAPGTRVLSAEGFK